MGPENPQSNLITGNVAVEKGTDVTRDQQKAELLATIREGKVRLWEVMNEKEKAHEDYSLEQEVFNENAEELLLLEGSLYMFLSPEMRAETKYAIAAVSGKNGFDGWMFAACDASDEVLQDKTFLMTACEKLQHYFFLEYLTQRRDSRGGAAKPPIRVADEDVAMAAIEANHENFQYLHPSLYGNKKVVLAAIPHNSRYLAFVKYHFPDLLEDPEIKAVAQNAPYMKQKGVR